jgi:hypothetical protein
VAGQPRRRLARRLVELMVEELRRAPGTPEELLMRIRREPFPTSPATEKDAARIAKRWIARHPHVVVDGRGVLHYLGRERANGQAHRTGGRR